MTIVPFATFPYPGLFAFKNPPSPASCFPPSRLPASFHPHQPLSKTTYFPSLPWKRCTFHYPRLPGITASANPESCCYFTPKHHFFVSRKSSRRKKCSRQKKIQPTPRHSKNKQGQTRTFCAHRYDFLVHPRLTQAPHIVTLHRPPSFSKHTKNSHFAEFNLSINHPHTFDGLPWSLPSRCRLSTERR